MSVVSSRIDVWTRKAVMELEQAYKLVLDDLEDRNSHTIGRLLQWDLTGQEDELMYRAWLVAKQFIEEHEPKLTKALLEMEIGN